MRRAVFAGLCLISFVAQADWEFSQPVEVGAVKGKIFHHLESANRKALSEARGRVALVWEDNRTGKPRCWLAVREPKASTFAKPKAITRANVMSLWWKARASALYWAGKKAARCG